MFFIWNNQSAHNACAIFDFIRTSMKLSMKNTTSMLEESAVQASNLVMESLEAKINMGRGLQNNIAIREYNSDWNRTLTVLKENMDTYSHIDIGIIDQNGMLYSQYGTSEDVSSFDYVKRALNGEIYVSDPQYDESVNDVIPELDKTYTEFEMLNESSNEIKASIEAITEISEMTSASSEEISASTMELSNSSRDLADSAENLAEQSRTIIEELNKFKL